MSNDTAPNYRHFALTEGLYEIHAESDMRSMLNPRPTKAVSSSSPSSTQGLAREWREAAGTRPRQSRQRPGPARHACSTMIGALKVSRGCRGMPARPAAR